MSKREKNRVTVSLFGLFVPRDVNVFVFVCCSLGCFQKQNIIVLPALCRFSTSFSPLIFVMQFSSKVKTLNKFCLLFFSFFDAAFFAIFFSRLFYWISMLYISLDFLKRWNNRKRWKIRNPKLNKKLDNFVF